MDVFENLNPEQRRAVEAVRGPVCILAGAGSGKTTTITRRIANQVATSTFRPQEILAVTFTDKAAGEMRSRLEALGAPGVRARTFHSAALAQLRHFRPDSIGKIVPSKALALRQIGNTLPMPYKFRPAGDLATEIEWAKNRRLSPERYRAELGDHEPPIPADLMQRVYLRYEAGKEERGVVDFEDILELTVQLFEQDDSAVATVRDRYRAFTVDEYQDVNLLQQTLLEYWVGPRDDLCVVGDDYQSIYAFTGASAQHLLAMPQRYPEAAVTRLEENYRSSNQILELANKLVPKLGGAAKTLRATKADGPVPELAQCVDEAEFAVQRIRKLDVAHDQVAILCRTNARLADFEEALSTAGIPSQGASFLSRESARFVLRRLGSPADVRGLAVDHGWLERQPDKLGERELVRQNDLGRLVRLAEELADLSGPEFVAELERRFGVGGDSRRGVHLLTLHGAKGLEFEAVFVTHVEEKELPSKLSKTPAEIAEERRLFYVGLTRAKRHLFVTWTHKPSRFLGELGVQRPAFREPVEGEPDDPVFAELKKWRLERSRADGVPAYVVFHNAALAEIAARKPRSLGDLASVPGVGPAKLERYGDEVLSVLQR
ncbi:MAG: ATP-dependent helicase UvrD/PcrA [Gaiellaceae bacterium]|nr:ATP-dependent helicase UvrD/PcrA [Gaiellaceae bacterium]